MPIECATTLIPLDQERFHALDKQVMAEGFAIHNSTGRFFDEKIYQSELIERCTARGIDAQREVEVRVTHGSFSKSYFLDLVLNQGSIYELKTSASLNPQHDRQLIHYLLLTGINHGKLVNFRPGSLQSRFVSTHLRPELRKDFQVDSRNWKNHDSRLEECLRSLLEDLGTFLEASLYREALLYLTRGQNAGIQSIPISANGHLLGHQEMHLLNPESAWHLSTIHDHLNSYETHIKRLLAHTPLAHIHWINLNQRMITLKTLKK